jgi:hypothetical protein
VQHTYINILVYENENIIGYAVLLITNQDISQESAGVFTLSLVANEAFSKEAQESGQITQEYVQGLMQQWKKPNGDGIITGAGILEITVHAIDVQTHKIIREKLTENDFITNRNYWSLTMNSIPGLPVHLTIPAEQDLCDDLSFHISVNCGRYLTQDSQFYIQILGSDFTAKKDSLIFWEPSGTDYYENDAYDHVYTNIVIYSGEHIVGYAILHFERIYFDEMKTLVSPGLADRYEGRDNEPTSAYHMEVIKSVSFPKVDGKYQNISMSYVNSCMQAVINGQ